MIETDKLFDDRCKHVHIACGDSFAESLKIAIRRLGWEETNTVISFWDNYSIGPIWKLHEPEGQVHRAEWMCNHIYTAEEQTEFEEMYYSLSRHLSHIPPQATITLWSSMNAREQVGMRYATYLLEGYPNELYTVSAAEVCDRLFNLPDLRIDYIHSGEIPANKLELVLKEVDSQVLLDRQARITLEQEWLQFAQQQEVLRICKGNTVIPVTPDYLDPYLLEKVDELHEGRGNLEFIKATRVIGQAIGYGDQYVGERYLDYRLRELVQSGCLEMTGDMRAIRSYSVRRSHTLYQADGLGRLFHIRELTVEDQYHWLNIDDCFIVNSVLELSYVDQRFTFTVKPIDSYTKSYSKEQTEERAYEDYAAYINNPDQIAYLAFVGVQVAGRILVKRNWNRYAYIEDIAVDRQYRRNGIGKALIEHAKQWAKRGGMPGLMLETQTHNVSACQLYEGCGFVPGGFDRYLYQGIDPQSDEIAIYWYLKFES